MSIKIGHASIDENGKISGGKAGDQTSKEICIRTWYSKPWNVLLECKDKQLAKKAADIMIQICNDKNFGYDQFDRLTGYNSIVKNNHTIQGAKGEFDCSSLVSTCYKLAGLNVSVANTTRSMRESFLGTGKFLCYTDAPHLLKDEYAKIGSIYLKEGSHVVMALENGVERDNPYMEPNAVIKFGMMGNGVKWVQYELVQEGYNIKIDGVFGKATDKSIKDYQAKHKLTIDGMVGPATRKCFKCN